MLQPFNLSLSLAIDAVIIALEAAPPWSPRRTALRKVKAQLERGVPAFGKKARAA